MNPNYGMVQNIPLGFYSSSFKHLTAKKIKF